MITRSPFRQRHAPCSLLIVDRRDGRPVGVCAGPDDDGGCPAAHPAGVPCADRRVIPLAGTRVRGLPFTISATGTERCPLAWLCLHSEDAR